MKKSKIIPLIAFSKIDQLKVKTNQTTLNIVKSIYYKNKVSDYKDMDNSLYLLIKN